MIIKTALLWVEKAKTFFKEKSGGKTTVPIKKIAPYAIATFLGVVILVAYCGPKKDHTFFVQTSVTQKSNAPTEDLKQRVSANVAALFGNGQKRLVAEQKKEADDKKRKVTIKYFASQITGENSGGARAIKSGSKLIGVLLNPIDTRTPSLVRVKTPQGGEASGVTIEPNSIFIGQYSYSGDGERVNLSFSRIDSPDLDSQKISAIALDASDYSAGIVGEAFTGTGLKLAATLGLNMFAGMADTLTDREAIGNSFNSVQPKPSMKNAILQGMSRASQDQAGRTASTIEQAKNYVIVPEGKEMIIEIQEDFKNERPKSKK